MVSLLAEHNDNDEKRGFFSPCFSSSFPLQLQLNPNAQHGGRTPIIKGQGRGSERVRS